ncbi:MAG: DNA polymerase III subunit delta [Methylovirgula sp.]|jgi:DNA polymerase-3 subunit delta
MVAIKNSDAARFLKNPPREIFLFLVCGTDAGLISERAQAIVARAIDDPKDPFQFLRLNGDDLAADPLRLADEANTIPLFGSRRAIFIDAGGKNFNAAIEPLINAPPSDCTIVIEAGNIKRDAPLRRLLEKDPRAAVIECYPDSPRDLAQLIDSELGAEDLTIEPDARSLLVSLLGQDRLASRGEIGKLVLYARGEGQVTVEHIEAIVADASALALDKAIDGAFEGDFTAIEETAERVFSEGGDYNALLGAALRHATLLHRMRLDAETGQGAGAQGGFGFRRATLDKHMRQWTSVKLARAIAILSQAIGKARREPALSEMITVRALWSVALAAKNKAPSS